MPVKASVSLTDRQGALARSLVAEGKYSSLSAAVQRAPDLMRDETEAREADTAALRSLLVQRRAGAFPGAAEARQRTDAMLARKRAALGLEG
ncbi:ribbon-helix-helix domain-containing protein [Paracoccus spongiarum]|uniref:Type II toxin-antitoxin system ParD family antitoxin n=1 Tax=Paracoccus spongiarum TaxID=3064387 RepID=A0ABT9JGQ5_9RHOB|nr:type II toxin-antitoxin system ParD family antitoxin [Paracoccus sp. 2205BS29-5]MDP5308966.1 type II toxin-antitoxin system ParD family antitoxin [Paracoccus sp. 2205BS29-5]